MDKPLNTIEYGHTLDGKMGIGFQARCSAGEVAAPRHNRSQAPQRSVPLAYSPKQRVWQRCL
jgi:hypothetical protein